MLEHHFLVPEEQVVAVLERQGRADAPMVDEGSIAATEVDEGKIAGVPALDASALVASAPEERIRLRLAILARSMGMRAREAETWLASHRFSRAEAREVAILLGLVDAAGAAGTDLEKWRWVRNAGNRSAEALRLAALLGEPGKPARSALSRRVRASRRAPNVTGRDIQSWLGIPPGPAVGDALAAVEVEGLRGAIRSRAAARLWLVRSRKGAGAPTGYNSDT